MCVSVYNVIGIWKAIKLLPSAYSIFCPAIIYTCTLPIHSAITRLDGLVCFSRVSFSDHVNSQLRQWDPWRALHGGHGSEIHLYGSETSPRPYEHVWANGWHFLDS